MRSNMDPLTPTTSTLSPAIAHIAEVSSSVATTIQGNAVEKLSTTAETNEHGNPRTKEAVETVRWVLDGPRRVENLVKLGRVDEAGREWGEVERLLDRWKDVKDVDDVRKRGQIALASVET